MKNNQGFGLTTMFAFLCFIGFCLLISYFSWNELMGTTSVRRSDNEGQFLTSGNKMKSTYSEVGMVTYRSDSTSYHNLEYSLKKYAKQYIEKYPDHVKEIPIIITLSTLRRENIVDTIVDSNHNVCNGYVVYQSDTAIYIPFLRCGNYATANYSQKLE